ncbi:hypothetical protein T8K17_19890 [Thalassobaculum sp. OXR-137]|uniref:polysaccharide deacetylase family protein n=1 Tax=Thalassobaculum sp. OXR-137 TaxID=3100173 RepID=UPI002AC98808|nr:hypothetical protein [Thalassobaculum sp. OXR-137]WPZ33484.1 hypothetical protein T8K17_19890 [Thalassobaculum sp. OXR-137]
MFAAAPAHAQTPIPRTVIALWEGGKDSRLREARSHQLATMPLEQLGLVVEYHRVTDPLPDLTERPDVRGVFAWLNSPSRPGAARLLEWYERALDLGKKLVIFGDPGISADPETGPLPQDRINRLLERLGVRYVGTYVSYTAGATYPVRNPKIWGFEHTPPLPPAFTETVLADPSAVSHLSVEVPGHQPARGDLVVTGPNGGLVAPSYAVEVDPPSNIRRWLINPFEFFRLAFATDDLPKPDTTTLVGRRLFYSHVDGDGWRSISEVKIDDAPASAARVLLERVIKRFPDLPVTIAPIAAELDPDWIDDAEARDVARAFFEQPQVEAGSHTYSHPFRWSFFADYDPAVEQAIVRRADPNQDIHQGYADIAEEKDSDGTEKTVDIGRYALPRAFFTKPFDLELEIGGSLKRIAEVGGKPVRVIQWSGDTSPFEAALREAREAGMQNINGGDTRFDSDYRSYGFVAPISVPVGAERQIYASMSNENTYTDLWSGRFFAYRHVLQTIRNTELPIRIKPINLYYHSYSAEKIASTNALIQVYGAMEAREIAPVTASHFARIADGFYATRLISLGDRRWRVEARGALETLRFDRASRTAVDFARSSGVLGARPSHGSLYVALDPDAAEPVVALTERDHPLDPDPAPHPYLLQSRWPVRGLALEGDDGLSVSAEGFGTLSMTWIVPTAGDWRVRIDQDGATAWSETVRVGDDRRLRIAPGADVEATVAARIRIERIGD